MTYEPIIELTVLILTLVAVASVLVWYLLTGTPPLPSSPAVKRAMLDALPNKLEGTVYDLGSGWGGMAFALARRYHDCRVIGFEVSPLPWVFSRAYGFFYSRRLTCTSAAEASTKYRRRTQCLWFPIWGPAPWRS
jgi:hypothetical protein